MQVPCPAAGQQFRAFVIVIHLVCSNNGQPVRVPPMTRASPANPLIEVAGSSLRLDRNVKGSLYARAGLSDYWIVNLADGSVEVYRDAGPMADAPHGVAYGSVEVFRPPDAVAPLATPGRPIPVADLLP